MRLATPLRREKDAGAKPSDYYCILCAGYGDAAGTSGRPQPRDAGPDRGGGEKLPPEEPRDHPRRFRGACCTRGSGEGGCCSEGTRREPGGAGARSGLTRWRQSPGRRHGGRVLRLQLRLLQAGGTCREGVDRGRCQCAGRLQGVPDPRPKLASGCKSGIGCAAAGQVRGVPRGAVRTARNKRGYTRGI